MTLMHAKIAALVLGVPMAMAGTWWFAWGYIRESISGVRPTGLETNDESFYIVLLLGIGLGLILFGIFVV